MKEVEDMFKDVVARTKELASQVYRNTEQLENLVRFNRKPRSYAEAVQTKSVWVSDMDKEGESEGNIEEGGSRSEVKDSWKPQIDSKKLKNGEHNHGEWTLVESLRRRKIKTLLGNKDQSGSEQHRIRVAIVRSRDF